MLWLSGVFPSNSQLHLEYWNNPILRPPIQKKITLTSAASSKHSTFGEKLHPNFDHVNQASKSYARCGLKPKRLYRTTANWIRFLGGNETNTSMQMIADAAEKQELRGYNGVWNNWSWKTRLACMYIYIYEHSFFDWGGEEGRQTCLEIYGFGARDLFSHMSMVTINSFPLKCCPCFWYNLFQPCAVFMLDI